MLETRSLRVNLIPELGGRISSLRWRATGREFLLQPKGAFVPRLYGSGYFDQPYGGFDECVPTVAPSTYPLPPWSGIALPPLGELWTSLWRITDRSDTAVVLEAAGVKLPYRFSRALRLTSERQIRLDYRLVNTSAHGLQCVWSTHPVLTGEAGMEIRLPAGTQLQTYWSQDGALGDSGATHVWPVAHDRAGRALHLDRPAAEARRNDKLFAVDLDEGWCSVHYQTGEYLRFDFALAELSTVGLWLNQCGLPVSDPVFCIALEPCSGFGGDLHTAWRSGAAWTLPPGSERVWSLSITLGDGPNESGTSD